MRTLWLIPLCLMLAGAALAQTISVPHPAPVGPGLGAAGAAGSISSSNAGASYGGAGTTLSGSLSGLTSAPTPQVSTPIAAAASGGGAPPVCSRNTCWEELRQCLSKESWQYVTNDAVQTYLNQAASSYDPNGEPPCAVDHQRCVARCSY